jgi:alkylhydroperoxidase family enzyme
VLCGTPPDDLRLKAAFDFLAAFAAGPEAIGRSHVEALRSAGVRDEAIRDLAQIAFCFCLINRVADALEFRVPPAEDFARSWPAMGAKAYRV